MLPLGQAAGRLLAGLALFACASCSPQEVVVDAHVFLLNLEPDLVRLDGEGVDLRHPPPGVRVRPMLFGDRQERGLILEDGHELAFGALPPGDSRLTFGLLVPGGESAWELEVLLRELGEERSLWHLSTEPSPEERRWDDLGAELSRPPGEEGEEGGELVLRVRSLSPARGGPPPRWRDPVLASPARRFAVASPPPRNVIVYLVDTLRADHLATYGYERSTTPCLDAIAEEALVFERAIAPSSWTKPSMTSFLTSLSPSLHGVLEPPDRLGEDATTLAERFRRAGYATAAFGANGWVFGTEFGLDRGFDRFRFVTRGPLGSGSGSRAVVDEALDWMTRHAHEPFFLYVHVIDPHAPYRPPAATRERLVTPGYDGPLDGTLEGQGSPWEVGTQASDERDLRHLEELYDAEIAQADAQLGRLVARARALGLWSETTLVFTSDHGEEFLDHGGWGHGSSLHEELLRVPLLIKPPASDGLAPERIGVPVSLIDVGPTLAELAGVPWGAPLPLARSLSAAIGGGRGRVVVSELVSDDVHAIAVRRGTLKVLTQGDGDPRVLRLDRDPLERRPLEPEDVPESALLLAVAEHQRALAPDGELRIALHGDGRRHALEVRIETAATDPQWTLSRCEPGDAAVGTTPGEATSLRWAFTLGPDDPLDVLTWSGGDDPIAIEVQVDGRELAPARIRLGRSGESPAEAPLQLALDEARLEGEPPTPEDPLASPLCRIWLEARSDAELSTHVRRSLEALGYL